MLDLRKIIYSKANKHSLNACPSDNHQQRKKQGVVLEIKYFSHFYNSSLSAPTINRTLEIIMGKLGSILNTLVCLV